ncbi:MAG: sulfatase [Halobacteriaceae archaeon]
MPDADSGADRPNVVVFLCDQLRRQALSCAGDPNVETPTVDGLAAEGARFENSCSTYPICVPARFSFVTGEHPHTRFVPGIDWRMSPAERTVADEFGDAGYTTAYVGKWHLSGHHSFRLGEDDLEPGERQVRLNRQAVPPECQGRFDHWRGFELRNDPFDTAYFVDDDPEPRLLDGYQTDGLTDLAVDFVEDHADDDEPFFLVVSVEPPHPPFVAPEAYQERWADRDLELRPNVPFGDPDRVPGSHDRWGPRDGVTEDYWEAAGYFSDAVSDEMRSYYAMIENVDDNVGRLLDALDREGVGVGADTAFAFLSDHGEMLGSHGHMAKQRPHEESVGVPFVVAGGGVEAGQVRPEPTCTEDWLPTLLGLAGLEPRDEKPGRNLAPLLRGETGDLDREGVLLEFVREARPGMPFAEETWRGFRTERYKYTVKGGMRGGEPWQLFDLREDPYEQENLVDDDAHEDVAHELHGRLRDALDRYDDPYGLRAAFGHDSLNVRPEPN